MRVVFMATCHAQTSHFKQYDPRSLCPAVFPYLQIILPCSFPQVAFRVFTHFTSISKLALHCPCRRNDVFSNGIALAAAGLAAASGGRFWWADGAGAILMSIYIISSWLSMASEQVFFFFFGWGGLG